jgi:hypothetical protein
VEVFKRQQLVQGLRSTDVGDLSVGSMTVVYALTEAGSRLARQHLEANRYGGKAPVPAAQYIAMVNGQRRQKGWLDLAHLEQGLSHMVTTPKLLSRLGPALNASKSLLVYGHPGNGKTLLAESIVNLIGDSVFLPYAIENNGHIIQLFDPIHHKRVDQSQGEVAFAAAPEYDQRWVQVRRPFVISGGELTLDVLDLRYDASLGAYNAPLQMKANNGVYLIDDLGRQRVSAREVLNRWIVPMEQGVDYLTFTNGSTLVIPFDSFLIFSTNLEPGEISDEAFLRRIQYKILVRDPDDAEFIRIFQQACVSTKLDWDGTVVAEFINRHYRQNGKRMRRCHPRDVLGHAVNLLDFHGLPRKLNGEILDEAFESCFLEEER